MDVKDIGPCIEWTGYINKSHGYGTLTIKGKSYRAHRFEWEKVHGPVRQGLVLDHLCRNIRCVNPDHLEAVTQHENILRGMGACAINSRKTECIRGHSLSGDNLHISRRGYRVCRECRNIRLRAWKLRKATKP